MKKERHDKIYHQAIISWRDVKHLLATFINNVSFRDIFWDCLEIFRDELDECYK